MLIFYYLDAIAKLSFREVIFGCSNDRFGGNGSILSIHSNRYQIRPGILKDEAISVFQQFYCSENKRAPESKRKRKLNKSERTGSS